MGFRCPVCKKDFGLDKKAFLEHIKNCKDGIAENIVAMFTAKNEDEVAIQIKKCAEKLKKNITKG